MRKYIIILLFFCLKINGQWLGVSFESQNGSQSYKWEYGYLYNYYAASDANFAPSGWHVPTHNELSTLSSYLSSNIGGKMKETGYVHWISPNTNATNSSGLSLIASGYRENNGSFSFLQWYSILWTSTNNGVSAGYNYRVVYNSGNFDNSQVSDYVTGFSIRLMRTTDPGTSTIADYDGNIYHVVLIGTQYWTVENWKCKHLNDGTLIPNVTDNTAWAALTTLGRCVYNNDESLK